MKKVINITIGKMVFAIDDDAYEALDVYLKAIQEYFSTDENSQDIVDDIEDGIAEKFVNRGKGATHSITTDDVAQIIAEMGTVAELSQDAHEEGSQEKETISEAAEGPRRLYRDTEDALLGGVAAGIAHFFNVDPTLIRLLFILTLFLGGFGVLIYLVLWLVVPPADTVSKKIRMEGGSATLSEIEHLVKNKIDDVPSGKLKKVLTFPFTILKKIFMVMKKIFLAAGPVVLFIVGITFVLGALVGLVGFSTSFMLMVSGGGAIDPVVTSIVATISQGFLGTLSLVGLYVAGIIPLLVLLFFGITFIRRKQTLTGSATLTLFIIWLLSVSVVAGVGLSHNEEIQSEVRDAREELEMTMVSQTYNDLDFYNINISDSVQVTITQGPQHQVIIEAPQALLDELEVNDTDGTLRIYQDEPFRICIVTCSHLFSRMQVTIVTPDLDELRFSGSVQGEIKDFETESLSARFSGSSRFIFDVVAEELNLRSSGSGHMTLIGSASTLDIHLSGSADIEGYEFTAKDIQFRSSGSSRASLSVIDSLDARISGSARVSYINESGEAVITKNISGSGSVIEVASDETNNEETE